MILPLVALNEQFDRLSPLTLKVYRQKKVLFYVPNVRTGPSDFNFLECGMRMYWRPEHVVETSKHRNIVANILLSDSEKLLIVTSSPIVLSDAFAEQIFIGTEDGMKTVSFATFGADPSAIMLHLLDCPESIGELSRITLDQFIKRKDWTIDELEDAVRAVGGGWPRAALREQRDKLLDAERA